MERERKEIFEDERVGHPFGFGALGEGIVFLGQKGGPL